MDVKKIIPSRYIQQSQKLVHPTQLHMVDEVCDALDSRVITPLTVARYRSCSYYLTAQNLQQTSSYEVIVSETSQAKFKIF